MPIKLPTLAIMGTGAAAHALAKGWLAAGGKLAGVWGRDAAKARQLARVCKTKSFHKPADLSGADVVILAVADDAIAKVITQIPKTTSAIIAHMAGSVPLGILKSFQNAGVLWPLQTLSLDRATDWKNIPIFFEGNSPQNARQMRLIAARLSKHAFEMASDKRISLHVAAVFAGNFVNFLCRLAEGILTELKIPFAVLFPLIDESVAKVKKIGPALAQTGPARRGDVKTLRRHARLLSPEKARLYRILSKMIFDGR